MSKLHKRLELVKLMDNRYPNRGTDVIGGKMSGVFSWNDIRYPQMKATYQRIQSNFWIPARISMVDDVKVWAMLSPRLKEAYLSTIGQLATLDGKQTRAVLEFARFVSDPVYHPIAVNIAQQEATHNESYSYMLSSLVDKNTESAVFTNAINDPRVLKRNERVDELYEEFVTNPTPHTFFRALVGCVVLEGMNFYSAFTFFYNLARNQLMVASSTMIGYIHRDEVQHAYFFSQLVRYVLAEIPELHTKETTDWIYDIFIEATEREIEWSHHNLADIDGIDLNELEGYIKKLANRRLRGLGLEDIYEGVDNSMPWMINFDDGSQNQTKTDTFEQKSRNYKKVNSENDMDDL